MLVLIDQVSMKSTFSTEFKNDIDWIFSMNLHQGTKYFQKMLANDEARNILLKDKYIFIGMCEEEARFDDCFYRNKAKSPFSSEDETELTPELQASFSRMQTEHINGLLIWDGAMPWIGKLKPFIKEFEVRIVATYRRLFDFLPSLYSKNMEKYKFPDGDAIGPLPFDFFTEDRLNELAAIKYARNFKWLAYHDGKHTTKDRLDTAASFNVDSLAIMDFHAKYEHENGNDLSIELFCTGAIPGTNHTCEAAKKNIIKGDMGNKDKKLQVDYFTFAYYAFKKGMLKARPHYAMVERIQNIMQNFNSTRFKKICMTESNLKKLYALSWKHEKIIYPERSEEGHKKAFEELKENGKFCSLDVLDVFRDERMRAWVSNWNMM